MGTIDIYNNIGNLYDEIRRKLSSLVSFVETNGYLNHYDINIDAETFYAYFLNKIKGWNLINQYKDKRNAKGIYHFYGGQDFLFFISQYSWLQSREIRTQGDTCLHREYNLAMENKHIWRIADVRSGKRSRAAHVVARTPRRS